MGVDNDNDGDDDGNVTSAIDSAQHTYSANHTQSRSLCFT